MHIAGIADPAVSLRQALFLIVNNSGRVYLANMVARLGAGVRWWATTIIGSLVGHVSVRPVGVWVCGCMGGCVWHVYMLSSVINGCVYVAGCCLNALYEILITRLIFSAIENVNDRLWLVLIKLDSWQHTHSYSHWIILNISKYFPHTTRIMTIEKQIQIMIAKKKKKGNKIQTKIEKLKAMARLSGNWEPTACCVKLFDKWQ